MNFPVFSQLARKLGFRDEFAPDCLLQRRVRCELAPAAGVQAVIVILGNHEFAAKSVPSAAPTAANHRGGSESLLSPGQNSSRSR